jgi:hypothetical protein
MMAWGANQAQQPHEAVWALGQSTDNTMEPTCHPTYYPTGRPGICRFARWLPG